MRINCRILIAILSFIGFTILSDTIIFIQYKDIEPILNIKENDNYYESNFNDTYFSDKAFSRPLHMSVKLINIAFQPLSYGMNEIESYYLLNPTKPFSCPKMPAINFKNYSSNCENLTKIKIFEPTSSFPENYGTTKFSYKLTEYNNNYKFSSSSEFGYVECDKTNKNVFLRNVFNLTAADKARKKEEKLKQKYKVESNYRPLTVILFIIDSVSRRSFYRNMEDTVKFFNDSIVSNSSELSKHFVLYDFLGNNAVKDLTRFNMVPFTFGISINKAEEQELEKSVDSKKDKEFYIKRQKKRAIWYYFKEKGFITMHLNDVVSDYLPSVTGRKLLVDHQVSNFWTLGNKYYGYSDIIKDYKCIGSEFSHKHSLNYLSQYLKNYQGYNKFAYFHLEVAHDFSATRLSLADKDIKNTLNNILDSYSNLHEDLFIVFAGDHGRYKFEFSSLHGKGERALPFHFIISNKDFIERNGFHKNLDLNSRRLISRYDWYKTLKHLANMPYTNITTKSKEYKNIKTQYGSLSVLIEKSSKDRKCEDIGIDAKNCISTPFKKVNDFNLNEKNLYSYFLNSILSVMENYYSKEISPLCNKIYLDKVLYIGEMIFVSENPVQPVVILEVFTLKNSKAVFMIFSSVANKSSFMKNKKVFHNFESYENEKISISGKTPVYSVNKIWSLTRLDIVVPGNIKLNKTSCEESTYYNYNYLYTIKGKSCFNTCILSRLECIDHRLLNMFIEFNYNKFKTFEIVGELNSLEIVNSTLLIGRYDMCDGNTISDSAICHCAQYK